MTEQTVWQRLAEPFDDSEVKRRPGALSANGPQPVALAFRYVDARHVAQRLDDVLGPENWEFDWDLVGGGPAVKGELSIVIWRDDGHSRHVTKADCGYPNSENDDKEPIKSAVSDAIRRCASLIGVARYLYEGTPQWEPCILHTSGRMEGKFKDWLRTPMPPPTPIRSAPPAAPQAPQRPATPVVAQPDPLCDAAAYNRRWHGTVPGSDLQSNDARHEFVKDHTLGRFNSLTAFLAQATVEEAEALMHDMNRHLAAAAKPTPASVDADAIATADHWGHYYAKLEEWKARNPRVAPSILKGWAIEEGVITVGELRRKYEKLNRALQASTDPN